MADTMHALEKNPNWKGRRGPVVLVIMDGVGKGDGGSGQTHEDQEHSIQHD